MVLELYVIDCYDILDEKDKQYVTLRNKTPLNSTIIMHEERLL